MTELPTHEGARVVAHTTANPTRRVFEHDGTGHRPWCDMDSQDPPYPLWRDPTALLDPVQVPYNPRTGEYLYYVPADATIPAGATYYRTMLDGLFYGPLEEDEPHTPTLRFSTPHTYWTVDPIPDPDPETDPEPEKAAPAGPSWWADLTDDQRARIEWLSSDQAQLVADLIQHKPGESTLVGDRGILIALRSLASNNADDRRDGLVLLLDAYLGGDL